MGLFVRKVRTAARAKPTIAVQLMRTTGGAQKLVERFGSAADEASVALLVADAERRKAEMLGSEQQALDLPGLQPSVGASAGDPGVSAARMAGTVARVLYDLTWLTGGEIRG